MTKADKEKPDICQLEAVIRSSPSAGKDEKAPSSFVFRVKRFLKRHLSLRAERRVRGLADSVQDILGRGAQKGRDGDLKIPPPRRLEAGDLVRVRSREEIEATLDRWRSFKGLAFLAEMAAYCGTDHKVLKRVERFMDERDYRMKKASGVVLLDGVTCAGTGTIGRCDRACFFFWREEWLEKREPAAAGPEPAPLGAQEQGPSGA